MASQNLEVIWQEFPLDYYAVTVLSIAFHNMAVWRTHMEEVDIYITAS